jgi:hypothetical protein
MSPWKLRSCLAVEIQNFINLRSLSGTDYQSQAQLQEKGRWFKCNLTGMEKASRMKTYVETSETRHSRCFTSCDGARD